MANQPSYPKRTHKNSQFVSKIYENECVYKTSMCSDVMNGHTWFFTFIVKNDLFFEGFFMLFATKHLFCSQSSTHIDLFALLTKLNFSILLKNHKLSSLYFYITINPAIGWSFIAIRICGLIFSLTTSSNIPIFSSIGYLWMTL